MEKKNISIFMLILISKALLSGAARMKTQESFLAKIGV